MYTLFSEPQAANEYLRDIPRLRIQLFIVITDPTRQLFRYRLFLGFYYATGNHLRNL